MDDLASRLASRVQLTTDGLKTYAEAVEGAFGADIDYAMLVAQRGPLQSCPMHRREEIHHAGQPRSQIHFNQSYRAPESNHPHVDEPIYPADQRLFKEGGELGGRSVASLHADNAAFLRDR